MTRSMLIILFIASFASCKEQKFSIKEETFIPAVKLNAKDPLLKIINGDLYHGDSLFSGITEALYPSGKCFSTTSYYKGKEEGWYTAYYENGNTATHRYYHRGEKDSVHTGYWENGKMKFEYHFNNGNYNGDFKEWYANGQSAQYIVYKDGIDLAGKGWRENGKIYMNYVTKDGRRYGLFNAKLCYTLKNEKGEYVNSTPIK